jgi:VPDSG-CTERM motif
MKHKFLFPFVTATSTRTLLSPITIITGALQANAAHIELVPSYIGNAFQGNYNWSFIGSAIPDPDDGGDRDLITDVPQNGDTFATSPAGSVKSSYKVLPSGFSGSLELVISAESTTNKDEQITALTRTVIAFRPTIDLRFDFEESYTGNLDMTGFSKLSYMNKDLSFPVNTGPTVFSDVTASGEPQGPYEYSFSTSGILFAGQIAQFETRSDLRGGVNANDFPLDSSASGSWSLKFRPAKSVPDAGSTMTLLGMALGGLGFFIRQRI